ncbi:MAG TPA: diguanylate cyclase [Terriglobia bacterium]|nr:diguanylate cyclase [Terriglobia bacterium]HVB29252.1 diguanylate cyclase [Terriglobia bacterium]
MNVLIAEDEPVSRRLLEVLLNKWGYEVTVTSDGDEAWRALQSSTRPRIAILDWMMPGMDGVQVCRMIRQNEAPPATYVLLLTAKQAIEDANGRYESVADDYLAKPYAAQELKARLRAARRIIELEDQLQAAREATRIETTHDPLTGLWNRSSIIEILHREIHRARRQRSPLAVLMVDIDHLKQINQQHGHLAGDAVLREAARRIRSTIRLYDSMANYGGGQFVVVSPACDNAGALSQAQRIRSTISSQSIKIFNSDILLTISLGIAVGGNNHQAHELIAGADTALAEAKRAGRNRAELAWN